ncbi:MAG: phosphatidylglycerophosphatase A [Gammaproteobacteria bacterium]|nr:phosphatidylglycerophosphatase A [Gammaproteobacteria bacterium]
MRRRISGDSSNCAGGPANHRRAGNGDPGPSANRHRGDPAPSANALGNGAAVHPARRLLLRGPGHFLALGGGAGLAPRAPGTFGSVIALPFVFLFAHFGAWVCAAAVVVGFAAGVVWCARAAEALGEADHPAIVWDEVVGMWAALCFIPLSWATVAAGFVLFRLFDIAKPWPLRRLERAPRGLGIMLDDLAAALFTNLALRLLLPYLP